MSRDHEAHNASGSLRGMFPIPKGGVRHRTNMQGFMRYWPFNMIFSIGVFLILWLFCTAFILAPAQPQTRSTAMHPTTHHVLSLPTTWTGWSQVPGGFSTPDAPGAMLFGEKIYLFARGNDNGIYFNTFDGTSWSTWSQVPGGGATPSAPIARGYGKLYLFVRGTDNRVYFNTFSGTTWSGWSEVPAGGFFTNDALGAAPYPPTNGKLYLFAHDPNGAIFVNILNGTSWSGWNQVPGGGATFSAPHASTYGNKLYLVVRGTDDKVYFNTFNGTSWGGWHQVPGGFSTSDAPTLPDSPDARQFGGKLIVFARGNNNKIYFNTFDGSNWSGWSEVPGNGATNHGPSAVPFESHSQLYLFVTGLDTKLYVNILS